MKALVVTQLVFNEKAQCHEEGKDYTFINPSHVSMIESCPLDILTYDEDLKEMMPRYMFAYKVTLVGGAEINCTVEDREFFFQRLVEGT